MALSLPFPSLMLKPPIVDIVSSVATSIVQVIVSILGSG